MAPSPVLRELQGLTQFQEMFIARAFPAMHVYTKPRGGQKACKGHVITLPQDVQQLADILPRFPKDLPVIVFIISGKNNDSKDFIVRKKVDDALYWLTGFHERGKPNNVLYQNVKIDSQSLQTLPENSMLTGVNTLECVDDDTSDEPGIDTGPDNSENYEKVYHDESDMSSFLPTNPNYPSNPKGPLYGLFCKYQLPKYKP